MVTIPDLEGPFESLLRILEDNMAPVEDRVDAYLRMIDHLREEEEVFVKELLGKLMRIIMIFKKDIHCDKPDLCQASLQALAYCLHQEQIASAISIQDGQDMIQGLLMRINDSDDKSVCTRALWCLAKQNLDSEIISSKLGSILISLELVQGRNFQSVTVDHEVLCVIQRLLEQLPKEEMIKTAECWIKLVLPFLGSPASKVRERCLSVLTGGLEHMISAQDKISAILVPLLKQNLIDDFTQMCSDKKELFVLKAWCCIVPVLGENLHKGGSLINNLLKLVEQGFRVPVADVQVMAFSAWTILIDNFALSLDVLCAPKRIKLIMTPFLNLAVKERHEAVEAARLSTWWHFVCLLPRQKVLELFDQVCMPLLHFVFGTSIDQVSSIKNREGFGDLKCPPTPTNVKLLTEIMTETPKSSVRRSLREMGTPRTPTVSNASFTKTAKQKLVGQGCEILAELLKPEPNGDVVNHQFLTVEKLKTCIFQRPEEFKKYASLLINAAREGFKALGKDLEEPLGAKIWSLLVKRIGDLLTRGPSPDYGEVLLPLLAVMQDFVDGNVLQSSLTIKMLEELSILPASILSHHMAWLHSKDNHQGSVALLLVQLLFEPTLLANIWNCERFHLTFEHLINCGMATASGQLFYMKTVLALLEKAASIVSNKDTLWRLWSPVVDQLNKHVLKTNDVNQGDVLEHDFSTLYLALTFPFRYLLGANLPQGTAKEVGKAVTELYRSFARAAALVSTAEINVCSEELCVKLLSVEGDWKLKDITFIDTLVILTGVIIECLDFSSPGLFVKATTGAGKSPNTTPTKWNKRSLKPMGNFASMVSLIGKLLSACERPDKCQDSPQTLGILTAVITNLIDKMSYLFLHISGTVTITALLKTLAPSLAPFIENSHTSTKVRKSTLDKRLFTARLIQKIEKLWTDLLTCIQSRHCGPYNSDFLAALSPLLEVTLCHPKRNIKNHAVMFWNATFAHAQWLNYPETLRPALQAVKDKMSLTLPGWQNMEVLAKESELENESVDLTQHTDFVKLLPYGIGLASPQRRKTLTLNGGSPQLLKGSFLHKAASAEKAVENLSPKKIVRSPKLCRPRNSPATTHARRKLPLSKYDDDDQEYVMIAPFPKKKRLLTEHQKEVMCSRREVPALYNVLDQSQDGTQFSQFSVASAAVTTDPSPNSIAEEVEEGKEFEPIKEQMITEDKSSPAAHITVSIVEEFRCQESDEQLKTQKEGEEGLDNSFNSIKEVEEVMNIDWEEENKQESSTEIEGVVCEKTAESDKDFVDIESVNVSGDDEGEVTSPDVIPSSQTPSLESPFQSLRRVTGPLKSLLPPSFPVLVNNEKTEKKEAECEATIIADVSSNSKVEEQNKCQSSLKGEVLSANFQKVSPVAGRTRQKLLQKTSHDRKSSVEEPEVAAAEKAASSLSKEEQPITDKSNVEACAEKVRVPTSTVVSGDTTSSQVPSPINKFLRPLAAGGSPSRVAFRGMSSPGVSPTTGILKRWPSVKQSVDSPSPPGKVRRVSFALPVKDSDSISVCRESLTDSVTTVLHQKPTSSSLFTAVKQRRSVSTNSEQSINDVAGCMYPELVSCSLPVEQILPSIVSMSWSRGLGHLVRAQNIHTIGNLSALKEEQVNNLPIRSPKVQTLKKALKKFHHIQKGRNAKKVGTKSSLGTLPREDQDVPGEAAVQKDSFSCEAAAPENQPETTHCVESPVEAPVEEIVPNMNCLEKNLSNDIVKSSEVVVGLDECDTNGLQGDHFQRESSELGESLTPQHTARDCSAVTATHIATPKRETFSLPTKLFSKEEEEEEEESAKNYTDIDGKAEENSTSPKTANDTEKDFEIQDANNRKSNFLRDSKSTIQEDSEQCNSEREREGVTDGVCNSNPKGVVVSDQGKFCEYLRSLKSLASPDVLHGLSSEEIFEAHHSLSEVMSQVVQALRSRWPPNQ